MQSPFKIIRAKTETQKIAYMSFPIPRYGCGILFIVRISLELLLFDNERYFFFS